MLHRQSWIALALGLLLSACGSSSSSGGGGGGPPAPTVTVTGVNGPLFADLATLFVVEGSGFGAPGDIVLVEFTTVTGQGTPFSNGTSVSAVVEAVVQNDAQCIGLSPPALTPGSFLCFVDVIVGGATGLSDTSIGTFVRAPSIPNIDYFPLIGPTPELGVIINGGAGADVLIGGPAPDELFGNDGNDYLDGGGDDDDYTGGLDFDAFAVDMLPGDTTETILDYTPDDDFIVTFGDPGDVDFSILQAITTVSDNGADVSINLTGGGAILLSGFGDGSVIDLVELLFAGVKIVVSLP